MQRRREDEVASALHFLWDMNEEDASPCEGGQGHSFSSGVLCSLMAHAKSRSIRSFGSEGSFGDDPRRFSFHVASFQLS